MYKIKEGKEDIAFNVVVYIILAAIFIAVLYPLVYVASASISSGEALMRGEVWLFPVDLSLEGYTLVFDYDLVWSGYANTIFYTVFGTLISVSLTIMIAYPLSRRDFVGRRALMFFLTFTMFFNGGLIPTFLLVYDLGLVNTRWAMLLPAAISVWNVIIARTFFESTIPIELYEAGAIDGCTNMRFLKSIVLPLSKPIIAVIALYYAVAVWNSYFQAMIYLRDQELVPLQIVLRNILIGNERLSSGGLDTDMESVYALQYRAEVLKYSLIMISALPLLMIYPFVQKFFVKGVMIGAVKG